MSPSQLIAKQREVVSRMTADLILETLKSLADPKRLQVACFKHALVAVSARQGLLFGSTGVLFTTGYGAEEIAALRRRFGFLLVDGRLTSYTRKPFVPGTSVVVRDGSTNGTGDLYGIGAALPAGQVIDAALLLERDTPFGPGELKSLDLWMDLMAIPLGAAVEYERAMRRKQNRRLRLADLRLEELEQLPTFEQVEYLLIQEAMRRTRHNKSAAARVLDMSRQGLQKRILRVLTAEA